MKISTFIFGMIFIGFCLSSLGGLYYAGAVEYSLTNYTNFQAFSKINEFNAKVESFQNQIVGNGTEVSFGEQFGFYIVGAGTVLKAFVVDYIGLGQTMVTDLISFTEIAIPPYVETTIMLSIILIVLLGILGIVLGGREI